MDMLDNDLIKIFTQTMDVPISFNNSIKNALYMNNTKNCKQRNIIKFIITFLMMCISSVGVVYAGANIHQYFTKVDKQNLDTAPGIHWDKDAEFGIKTYEENSNYFYKFITEYDDYLKCKERWNNLYKMEEKDFEDSYVLMISWLGRTKITIVFSRYKYN